MSLQIWLPLNGDLHNQGTDGWIPSGSGISYIQKGKIGQARSAGSIIIPDDVCKRIFNNKSISITFWVYINLNDGETNNRMMFFGNDDERWFGLFNYPTANDFHWDWRNTPKGSSFGATGVTQVTGGVRTGILPTKKWIHIAVTCDNKYFTMYLDGEEKIHQALSNPMNVIDYSKDTVLVSNNTYYYYNDYRIYDHCLSQKEVKEIAKGLMMHYKLTDVVTKGGQINLIKGSNTDSTVTNSFRQSNAIGGTSYSIVYEDGIPCVKTLRDSTEQSSWTFFSYNNFDSTSIKTNTTYTISFEINPSVNGSIGVLGFVQSNATNSLSASAEVIQGNAVANQWNKIILQTTTKADFTGITIPGQCIYMSVSQALRGTGVSMLLKNMKVEEGSIATPWCPNPSDALYTALGYNNNIEYDCSGFENNGIINGIDSYPISAPRGTNGTYFPTNNYIMGKYLVPEEFTLTSWVKPSAPTTYGNIYIGNWESGGGGIYNTTAAKMVFELYINGAYKVLTGGTTLIANNWYHVACTYKNGVQKIYINGKQDGSLTTTLTSGLTYHSTAPWAINANPNGTGSATNTGSAGYSDVRLYTTVLSAEDIKNLYSNGISIDNNENVFAYEFREE